MSRIDPQARICPDCRKPLAGQDRDGIHVDVCESCSLLWLDAGELEALGNRVFSWPRPDGTDWVGAGSRSDAACPGCGAAALELGSVGDHTVQRCGACRGHVIRTGSSVAGADLLVDLLTFLAWS